MAYGPRSARTTPLPPTWAREIRPAVLARDGHACTWEISRDGTRCGQPATDVDHIGDPADHSLTNLRSLCGPHHARRTGAQAATARWARRAPRARPAEAHPGLLPGPRP